jgi:hypothetical protein
VTTATRTKRRIMRPIVTPKAMVSSLLFDWLAGRFSSEESAEGAF